MARLNKISRLSKFAAGLLGRLCRLSVGKRRLHSCSGHVFGSMRILAAGVLLAGLPALAQQDKLPTIVLFAGEHEIIAEVAATDDQRQIGLQGRKTLAEGTGMLFDFHEDSQACMWMEKTSLHLDAVFLAADGEIAGVARMFPYMKDTHCSPRPVRYVLELPAGWLARQGLAAGDRIAGLDGSE